MSKLYKEKPVILYHYSVERYSELSSLFSRNLEKEGFESDKNDPFSYNKSISFFLEPIPLDLPKILENKHKFWKSGTKLYEYKISTSQLLEETPYVLVESEEVVDLIYNKQDWDKAKGNPELIKKYKQDIKDLELKLKYRGTKITDFIKVSKKYSSGIKDRYKKLVELDKKYPQDNLLDKYAATVPHVMIYVSSLKIKPISVKQITLN